MFVIENENITAFDVDETLVLWNEKIKDIAITCPYTGKTEALTVHTEHVNQLIKNKARGNSIIVWSAGGYQWAKAVVIALDLLDHVDLILSKPNKFFDDLQAEQILVNRVYIKHK